MNRIPLWVDVRKIHVQKRLPILHAVRDCGVEAVLTEPGDPHMERDDVPWRMIDGQRILGNPPFSLYKLASAQDQERAIRDPGPIVVDADAWRIVPLENLLAERTAPTFAIAHNAEDAGMLADVLDVGVDGILIAPERSEVILEVHRVLMQRAAARTAAKSPGGAFLQQATVTEVRDAGSGERLAIDTTSALDEGEGLLVGGTARSFALVLAETRKTPFIPARPFRINAGSLQSYIYAGGRTCYASEIEATSPILAVHPNGVHRVLTCGRAKLERRPHTLVRWRSAQGTGYVIVQSAETVCFGTPNGAVPVTKLTKGATIWVHTERAGRHAGKAIEAAVTER